MHSTCGIVQELTLCLLLRQIKGKTASSPVDDDDEEEEEEDSALPNKEKTPKKKSHGKGPGIHEEWSKLVLTRSTSHKIHHHASAYN